MYVKKTDSDFQSTLNLVKKPQGRKYEIETKYARTLKFILGQLHREQTHCNFVMICYDTNPRSIPDTPIFLQFVKGGFVQVGSNFKTLDILN